mgnify:CR=1 FL=1
MSQNYDLLKETMTTNPSKARSKPLTDEIKLQNSLRFDRFVELTDKLQSEYGISHGDLSRWYTGENTKDGRETISRKRRRRDAVSAIKVSHMDVVFLEMMLGLTENGYDLKSVEFGPNSSILQLDELGGED